MQGEATRQQPDEKGKKDCKKGEEGALQTHRLAAGLWRHWFVDAKNIHRQGGGNIKTEAEKIKQRGKLLCVQVEGLAVQI